MEKIAVIGCGGTGSFLLPLLLRMTTEEEIVIFDGDTLSKKNLDRQLFRPEFVGRNKALALVDMYNDERLTAEPSFLSSAEALEGFDLIFACPDNHVARTRVLEASDAYGIPAIICGNEYNSSSAYFYGPTWGGTPSDPRVRYPEILTDLSGSPTGVSCTGEAQESAPQLALANNISAVYAIQLMYFWLFNLTGELATLAKKDSKVYENFPIEFDWVPTRIASKSIKRVREEFEYYESIKKEADTDGHAKRNKEGSTGDNSEASGTSS